MKIRIPEYTELFFEGGSAVSPNGAITVRDACVSTELRENVLVVTASSETTPLTYIRMRWSISDKRSQVKVFSDTWERGYGDLAWQGICPQRTMPWVCAVSNGSDSKPDCTGRFTECFGVKVRPAAMCFWQYDECGVTLTMDIRNGASGVIPQGRKIEVCRIVFGEYRDMTAFRALKAFYKTLCDDPLTVKAPVYGSNNWYYAYGHSSHEEILHDTRIVAEATKGLKNRPFMVIDDGWTKNMTDAPWTEGGERFPDMKALACGMRAQNVRPGIWIRYLADQHHETPDVLPEMRMMRDDSFLDPSHPAVCKLVGDLTRRIVDDWGYELIKHDYSTYDIFGDWGMHFDPLPAKGDWHFYDRTRTSAEIVVGFYRTIWEATHGKAVIIGCNVIGHLTAGLAHLNRTGDDTSGREWERTRKMGVNTLAFRALHDKAFYAADADCCAITECVPWKLTSEWLRALSCSGTPLFVSCKPGVMNESQAAELRAAFTRSSIQSDCLEPIDWMDTTCPSRFLLNGQEVRFDWIPESGVPVPLP